MNWMYKLEQKFGKYAIYDLHKYFVFAYIIGEVLSYMGTGIVGYLNFDMDKILQGQIWRLVTWVFSTNGSSGIFAIIFMLCLLSMGQSLQHFLGVFRMNVYLIGGVILNIVGGVLIYFGSWIFFGTPIPVQLSLYYILLSMFMALAICIPDATVNLYFILPIRMKWMLLVYILDLVYELYVYYSFGAAISIQFGIITLLAYGAQILLALLNLFLFFYFSKIRLNRKQRKTQQEFRKKMSGMQFQTNEPRHKCAICGKTEKDDPELVFRFCSKCTGNREYCQEHLFTHTHK